MEEKWQSRSEGKRAVHVMWGMFLIFVCLNEDLANYSCFSLTQPLQSEWLLTKGGYSSEEFELLVFYIYYGPSSDTRFVLIPLSSFIEHGSNMLPITEGMLTILPNPFTEL